MHAHLSNRIEIENMFSGDRFLGYEITLKCLVDFELDKSLPGHQTFFDLGELLQAGEVEITPTVKYEPKSAIEALLYKDNNSAVPNIIIDWINNIEQPIINMTSMPDRGKSNLYYVRRRVYRLLATSVDLGNISKDIREFIDSRIITSIDRAYFMRFLANEILKEEIIRGDFSS